MLARAIAAIQAFRWPKRAGAAPEVQAELREIVNCDGTCEESRKLRTRVDLGLRMASAALSSMKDAAGTTGPRKRYALHLAQEFLWRFVNDREDQSSIG